MENEDLFILNPKQQQAFEQLRKALDKCKKLNMYFYNNYGTLGVTDKSIINKYDDDDSGILDDGQNQYEIKLPCNEWADDRHYFHPAKKTI